MKISTVTVGIPVFSVKASVRHSIVRKPTVFERMVLRLSRRGQVDHVVGGSTIRQAFEDHLGVQGVPQLLETTVSGLVGLGVLKPSSSSSQLLIDREIRTFVLTPEGEDFYNRNTLPSRPMTDAVDFSYTPWSNALTASRPGKLTGVAPEFRFDEALLRPRDVSSLVRRELEGNRPRFLKMDSRILEVDAQITEGIGWLTLDVELHASPEGYLDLKTANKSHENWLNKLEPSVVQRTFLDAVTGYAIAPEPELNRDVLTQAKRLTLATTPLSPHATSIVLPSVGTGLTITLDAAVGHPSYTKDGNGRAVITCPPPSTVPPQLASVTVEGGRPTSCLVEGGLALTWSGGLRQVRVLAEIEGAQVDSCWQPFGEDLAATLASCEDPVISTVPFHWGSDRPIDSLNRQLANLPLPASLEKIGEFLTAANVSGATFQRGQSTRLAEAIALHIEATSGVSVLDIAGVDNWLRFIIGALGSDSGSPALRRALLAKATPPRSAREVRQLLALERDHGQIPARLLGSNVLAAVLEEIWADPRVEVPAGNNEGLRTLHMYRKAQADLDASLGRRNADLAATSQRVVATKSVGQALRAADRWLAAVDDPKLALATGDSLPVGLLEFREKVRSWREAANTSLAAPLESNQVALVFDSNTLLDHPAALRGLATSHVGVVPNRVLQELDGLKRSGDEAIAQRARQAIRTIDDLREGASLRFENARVNLIPRDLGPTDEADNQILSVAVALSGGRVTLVTGDKNLRSKAAASSIEALDWPSLQKGRGKGR